MPQLWVSKLAFLADITAHAHLNELNKKLQGKGNLVGDMFREVEAFEARLDLFEPSMVSVRIKEGTLTHFLCLASLPAVRYERLNSFATIVSNLHTEFKNNFKEFYTLEADINIFVTPFSG